MSDEKVETFNVQTSWERAEDHIDAAEARLAEGNAALGHAHAHLAMTLQERVWMAWNISRLQKPDPVPPSTGAETSG